MSNVSAVVVLRHNISLEGDVFFGLRELEALAGPLTELDSQSAIAKAINSDEIAALLILTKQRIVAVKFESVDFEAVQDILYRSAFAQEVILFGSSSALDDTASRLRIKHARVQNLLGDWAVIPSLNYLVETEDGFSGKVDPTLGRIAAVSELVLAPFLSVKPGSNSLKARSAVRTTLALTHDLHIYKAKFFPRMVRAALNIFAPRKGLVVDPFVGSGTALLEAGLMGYSAFGVDIDPICALISGAKVNPFLDELGLKKDLVEFATLLEKSQSQSNVSLKDREEFPDELMGKLARQDARNGTNNLAEIAREVAVVRGALLEAGNGFSTVLPKVLVSDAVTKKVRYRYVGVGNGRYTIEVLNQPLLERLKEKIDRCLVLEEVFKEVRELLPWQIIPTSNVVGSAFDSGTWALPAKVDTIITSPPYLPASSGREHYASSRALAFYALGLPQLQGGTDHTSQNHDDLASFGEANALLNYLNSNQEANDPQNDAMRFVHKYPPTIQYLRDMLSFFRGVRKSLKEGGTLILVVASQHMFYSHKRNEVEHVVNCGKLYSELAEAAGLSFDEEIKLELHKSSASRAKPRAKDAYHESLLIFRLPFGNS